MLKAIYVGKDLKITGEFVPNTRPYIRQLCIPNLHLRKGNLNVLLQHNLNVLLQQRVDTLLSSKGQET